MLEDLKILNGELSPTFDKYNNIYSVGIKKDVNRLVMEYIVTDGYDINIIDNTDLQEGENKVYIQVFKENEVNIYTLLVYKEVTQTVFDYNEILDPVEVEKELPEYVAPLIGGICFIIILIIFLILFKKRKVRK